LFVHALLYDLFVYRLYLKSLPGFNLNSSPLSRDHVYHYVLYIEVLFRGHMVSSSSSCVCLVYHNATEVNPFLHYQFKC